MEMKNRFFVIIAAVLAAVLFAGCEDGVNLDADMIPANLPPITKNPPTTVTAESRSIQDGGGLLEALGNPLVGTVEIETDIDAATVDLDIKTAKTIVIPAGLTLAVGTVKASANVVIVGKDSSALDCFASLAMTDLHSPAMMDIHSGGAGVMKVNGGFRVDGGAAFEVKENANLAFNASARSVRVDGVLTAEKEGLIYSLGNSGLNLRGAGSVKIGGGNVAAAEFTLYARRMEGELIEFYNADYSSGTVFETEGWAGAGEAGEAWTLIAGEYGTVYFAVSKAEWQSITVGGEDAASVTKHESGSVERAVIDDDGNPAALAANDTRMVFAVDTAELVFEGGNRNFTLSEGGRAIPVTVNVRPNLTGAAVFLVERDEDGAETLTRKDTGTADFSYLSPNRATPGPAPFSGDAAFLNALAWADYHTESNQEWLVRVEAAETAIPRTILTGGTLYSGNTTVKIRLRGHGDTEHVIKHDESNAKISANNFYGRGTSYYTHGPSKVLADGMISVISGSSDDAENPHLTLQLEKGITLQGLMTKNPQINTSSSVDKTFYYENMVGLGGNSALVMKSGSKITGHYLSSNGSNTNSSSVIRSSQYAGNSSMSVTMVTIEAGAAITGNKLTAFEQGFTPNGENAAIIQLQRKGSQPNIFISKGAVIQDNVIAGEDNVNIANCGLYLNAAYDIKSDGNGDHDIILPPQ
jgi:hypothetical protein